jgi:NADH-quinone oxidoreductase subunit N
MNAIHTMTRRRRVMLLSMATGNIIAIAQSNIKRMLAYSTIAHMGFLLLGLLAGTRSGYAGAMF